MLNKLRLKFVLINMGIVTAMLLVIFSFIYHFTKADLEEQSVDALRTLSQSTHQPGGLDREVQLPYFTLQISPFGDIVVNGSSYYDLKDEAFIQELIQAVYTAQESMGMIEKYDLRYNRVSSMGGQKLIFVDVSGQDAVLRSLLQTNLLIGAGSLIAFLGISILLARWAVRPVDQAWQQQRQFVSDASHELKTPLTVIMSNAELLQNPDCEEESRGQFAGNILSMSYRMRSLVEGLLELARADNGQIKKNFAAVDYSKLVSDSLLPFEPVMYERGLILESKIEPGITMTGSEQYLRQLGDILLDNAAKYSAPGIVAVELRRGAKGQCLLTVSNPGEPIPREDLKRIFQRFYRSDKARTGTGSFGLGLSIAESIVTEHKGRIWAESNSTGNRFCVQLPCK